MESITLFDDQRISPIGSLLRGFRYVMLHRVDQGSGVHELTDM